MFEEFYPNSEKQQLKLQEREQEKERVYNKELVAMQSAEQSYQEMDSGKSDLIKWQQELDNELLILKYRLMNYHKKGDHWVPQEVTLPNGNKRVLEPLLTEEGIQMIEAEVQPFLSKNLINSNLDENRILRLLKLTSKTISRNMAYNYDSYITKPNRTPQNMSHIKRIIKNVIIPTPFRAINGWTKKQDNLVSRRVETFNDSNNQNDKKGWGFFGK